MYDRVKNVSIIDRVGNSDHCTISMELSFGIIRKKTYARLIWQYNRCDFNQFRTKLWNYDWDSCFDFDNIDEIANAWTNSFLYIARECIPNKIVKIYPNDKPFYNSKLRKFKKRCTRARKLAVRLKTEYRWNYYRQLRNEYNHCWRV